LSKNQGRANETTGDMQAQKEAKAAMAKKLKSGGYWENEADIDKVRFFEPMLAYKLVDYKDDVIYPTMVDRKYNGGRVVANREGLKTRKGETYQTIPHIWESIESLFKQFPYLVIDGEGYNHTLRFKLNQLMSILNTKKSTKITSDFLAHSKQLVRYYVYDGYGFTVNGVEITKETPCIERREALKAFLAGVQYIEVVPHEMADSEESVMKLYDGYVEDGYEGAIIRNPKAEYQNKRTKDLLKVKPLDDAEFVITGVEPGVGNWAGKAKRIWFKDQAGKTFKGSFKGSMEQAAKFLEEKNKWIGQTVTVHYNGLTEYGVPNYAQLDINNCIKLDR
jgi:DNA ligase-1